MDVLLVIANAGASPDWLAPGGVGAAAVAIAVAFAFISGKCFSKESMDAAHKETERANTRADKMETLAREAITELGDAVKVMAQGQAKTNELLAAFGERLDDLEPRRQ